MGSTTATMALTITRFLPSTSASVPVNGAVMAIASALAVMMLLMPAAATPSSRDKTGSSACGE